MPVYPLKAAPQLSIATINQSSAHHIMSLGEDPLLTTVADVERQTEAERSSCHKDIARTENNTADLLSNFTQPSDTETTDTGKGKEVDRGRSAQRIPRVDNPLDRAQSRSSRDIATIEVNVKNIEARNRRRSSFLSTFVRNTADPRADFEDNLLEPCPDVTACYSMSDVIRQPLPSVLTSTTILSRMAVSGLDSSDHVYATPEDPSRSGTEDRALYPDLMIPPENLLQVMPTMNHEEFLELKSSLRESIVSPASARLPQEIVRQILYHLGPADFNSARHACRLWYISSLERHVLETMLKRGGWSKAIRRDIVSNYTVDLNPQVSNEWLMSKRIARECALGPDWTGNGQCSVDENASWKNSHNVTKITPITHTSTTDFTEPGVQYPYAEDGNAGLTFTVSTCGKFLMLATGCLVYVYELNRSEKGGSGCGDEDVQSGALQPITSVICPRRVLACSMDTSSQRYAIAVLMDDRMGLVCDLTGLSGRPRQSLSTTKDWVEHTADALRAAPIHRGGDYRNRISIKSSRQYGHYIPVGGPAQRFTFPVIAAAGSSADTTRLGDLQIQPWQGMLQSNILEGSIPCIEPPDVFTSQSSYLEGSSKGKKMAMNHMPIEQSLPTMYAPLCSADDPPRSVALCPQRRCVAFGCSAGIELHWVDALTGQDLNRWFPLTAPSDYLFFLPPRAGIDSAKKLRLISSAGQPAERPVMAENYGSKSGSSIGDRSKSTPFWTALSGRYSGPWVSLGAGGSDALQETGKDNSDHYRAIPLSDGYHILFTDPTTGLLCLGSDAPIGGPTKLLRKIWFAGPDKSSSPVAYAGASDMRYGVRVIAAYGSGLEKSIWLFSVPEDVFAESMTDHGPGSLPFVGNSLTCESRNRDWINWWTNGQPQDWIDPVQGAVVAHVLKRDKIWPVQIRGQLIGKCRGVTELAIDAGPEMTIWAFARDGQARTWQIDDGNLGGTTRHQVIARDGTVRKGYRDGYTARNDDPLNSERPEADSPGGQTYDGTASMSASDYLTSSFDEEGDTAVTALIDVPYSKVSYEYDDSFDTVDLEHDRYETMHHNNRLTSHSCAKQIKLDGLSLLEETGGIWIDIDIR